MSNYITRSKVLTEACKQMLKEAYRRAQPSIDIEIYSEKYKNGELDPDKDRCYEWHYLPQEVQSQIIDDYLDAYGANDQFKKECEFLFDLFKNGGHRTVYKDIFNEGKPIRTGEKTEKLNELIGSENAEKVYSLINDFLGFYRTNSDEMTIRGIIFQFPTCNPKTVIEHYGGDFKIDESVYMDYDNERYDYRYKDYIDGKITGDDYLFDRDDECCICCCEEDDEYDEETEEV